MSMHKRFQIVLSILFLFFLSACQVQNESIELNAADLTTQSEETATVEKISPDGYAWLSFDSDVLEKWEIEQDAAWPEVLAADMVHFEPTASPARRHVTAIFSKESSAYASGLNEILSYFDGKNAGAGVTVIQMNNSADRLDTVISWAEETNTDLILSFGSNATAWMHDVYQNGPVPVISVTSKDPVLLGQIPDYEVGSGSNFAYTSLNVPIEVQLAYLQQFRPELEQIGILYAENNTSAVETQVLPLAEAASAVGVESLLIAVEDQSNAQAELVDKMVTATTQMLATDPNRENSLLWVTGSTSVFNEIETINQYAAGFPVLSVVTDVTQAGPNSALMSIGIGFETNAQVAGRYAYDVLNGTDPGTLPVGIVSPPDIAINFLVARENNHIIPFSFFESATFVYDPNGLPVNSVSP
ncbi:MAG: ABC transporter substrate binding protein [Chloroflexota bacterium]